jgi:hypothetical protein
MSERPSPSAAGDAVTQYEEVLRDAAPEAVEQIHADAFEQLSAEQRERVFEALVDRAGSEDERPADASPSELARAAAAAEQRSPGTLAGIARGSDPFGVDRGLINLYVTYAIGSELALLSLGSEAPPDGPLTFGGGFDGDGGVDGL